MWFGYDLETMGVLRRAPLGGIPRHCSGQHRFGARGSQEALWPEAEELLPRCPHMVTEEGLHTNRMPYSGEYPELLEALLVQLRDIRDAMKDVRILHHSEFD